MSNEKVQNKRAITAFAWFFFIAIILGQLGVLLPIAHQVWEGVCICEAITKQVLSGNFLTFSTAFLASSVYFLIREYMEGEKIPNSIRKAQLMLCAAALGLAGIIVAYLIIVDSKNFGLGKALLHWLVYVASIFIALKLWSLEHDESGDRVAEELQNDSDRMTKEASLNNIASDGTLL